MHSNSNSNNKYKTIKTPETGSGNQFQLQRERRFNLPSFISIRIGIICILIGLLIFTKQFLLEIDENETEIKIVGGNRSKTYKPVVIIHGILDDRNSLQDLADRIMLKHPGTNVTIIDKLHGWRSISPIWFQVNSFSSTLIPIMNENPGGIHLIGYSQGGLVARGLIQSISNHTIHNFISLSSPQAGQFGDDFLHIYFPNYAKETAYRIFYTEGGQLVSVGNYWRDPHEVDLFLNYSTFIARVNNLVGTPNSTQFKDNFLKLKKMVLIGGPDDGIICPWQSSHFGFYDDKEAVVDMRNTAAYTSDSFGLRSLDLSGRIVTLTVPGVVHLQWHKNLSVMDNHILPYLD